MKKLRATTSLVLLFSGIVLLISSIILFVAPPTHVGHFSPWRMIGLGRCQWNLVHIMSGLLFVLASLVHAWLNWNPVRAYLGRKDSATPFRWPVVAAAVLTAYICAGSLAGLPPMRQFVDGLRLIKGMHVRDYGVPPYGFTEQAELREVIRFMGWKEEQCLGMLKKNGLSINSTKDSLAAIANNNGLRIGALLDAMHEIRDNTSIRSIGKEALGTPTTLSGS